MQIEAIREYLSLLMTALSVGAKATEIEETEDGPVLLCSMDSPFVENGETGYRIEIIPIDDRMICAETALILFTDVSAERFDDLDVLLNELNDMSSFGNFRLLREEDNGVVMYVQGSVFDDQTDITSVTGMLGKTITIMENTAGNTGGYIKRCIDGEDPVSLAEEIAKEE